MTPKGQRVIRVRRDLLYDPKGHGTFVVGVAYFMTPKVMVTFVVGLT